MTRMSGLYDIDGRGGAALMRVPPFAHEPMDDFLEELLFLAGEDGRADVPLGFDDTLSGALPLQSPDCFLDTQVAIIVEDICRAFL